MISVGAGVALYVWLEGDIGQAETAAQALLERGGERLSEFSSTSEEAGSSPTLDGGFGAASPPPGSSEAFGGIPRLDQLPPFDDERVMAQLSGRAPLSRSIEHPAAPLRLLVPDGFLASLTASGVYLRSEGYAVEVLWLPEGEIGRMPALRQGTSLGELTVTRSEQDRVALLDGREIKIVRVSLRDAFGKEAALIVGTLRLAEGGAVLGTEGAEADSAALESMLTRIDSGVHESGDAEGRNRQ